MNFKREPERIKLHMSMPEAFFAMSDGNPGALNVLIAMGTQVPVIDPANVFAQLAGMMLLDGAGIYGSRIYLLHNDLCDRSMVKVVTILRCIQMGLIPREGVYEWLDQCDTGPTPSINFESYYSALKVKLPDFNPGNLPVVNLPQAVPGLVTGG